MTDEEIYKQEPDSSISVDKSNASTIDQKKNLNHKRQIFMARRHVRKINAMVCKILTRC